MNSKVIYDVKKNTIKYYYALLFYYYIYLFISNYYHL